jgi:hypothetical protein
MRAEPFVRVCRLDALEAGVDVHHCDRGVEKKLVERRECG